MSDVDRFEAGGVPQFLGLDAARNPFIAECVAVDVTSALRGSEVGIRALRQRPLVRRVWESATGAGNERLAAIGSDLVAVQKATLRLVWDIVGNEGRTWACLEKVLENLHAVNRDLDAVMKEASELRTAIVQTQTALSELEVRVSGLRDGLDREASLRRVRDQYGAGVLDRGFGPLVRAALYVAHVRAHFHTTGEETACNEETRTALDVATASLASEPRSVAELVAGEIAMVSTDMVEALVYVTTRQNGPLCSVLGNEGKRRLAQLPVTESSVREAIVVAGLFDDSERFLDRRIRRPAALFEKLVAEFGA